MELFTTTKLLLFFDNKKIFIGFIQYSAQAI